MSLSSSLPDNRTHLEVALEKTIKQSFANKYSPFETLWRPYEVPAQDLPWLAEAMGSDEWSSDDTEQEKRDSLAWLWPRQREAGMGIAVRRSIEPLGVNALVVPWHAPGGSGVPYELDVFAFVGDKTLTRDVQTRLYNRARRAASERDVLTLKVGVFSAQQLNLGGVVRFIQYVRLRLSDA